MINTKLCKLFPDRNTRERDASFHGRALITPASTGEPACLREAPGRRRSDARLFARMDKGRLAFSAFVHRASWARAVKRVRERKL